MSQTPLHCSPYYFNMCANYTPSKRQELEQRFAVAAPDSDYKDEAFPTNMAPFIRPPRAESVQCDRAAALGMFGLVPSWAKDPKKLARNTYNARTETVAEKPSYRSAFKRRQFCVIPLHDFYEPNYETGKAVRWRIADADGAPLGVAGLWEYKQDGPNGLPMLSFTMLTINADGHPLMKRFHKPDDEKRMLVILRSDQYDEWLHCPVLDAAAFFEPYPAERLTAHPAPRDGKNSQHSLLRE